MIMKDQPADLEYDIAKLNDQIASYLVEIHALQKELAPLELKVSTMYNKKFALERKLVGVQKLKPKGFRLKTISTQEVKSVLSDDLTALLASQGVVLKGQ